MSEATAVPTEPQPLPIVQLVRLSIKPAHILMNGYESYASIKLRFEI